MLVLHCVADSMLFPEEDSSLLTIFSSLQTFKVQHFHVSDNQNSVECGMIIDKPTLESDMTKSLTDSRSSYLTAIL